MTYEALAQARGTTKRAAVVLVRRKKWPRQTNNAGHVTALVPVTWAGAQDQGANLPLDAGHSAPDGAGHAIEVLERALEALREAHAGALGAGLSDLGRGLGAIADELESGALSPADVVVHLRAFAAELKDIAGSV